MNSLIPTVTIPMPWEEIIDSVDHHAPVEINIELKAQNKMEEYFKSHAQVEFTHGYCPGCAQALLAGVKGDAN